MSGRWPILFPTRDLFPDTHTRNHTLCTLFTTHFIHQNLSPCAHNPRTRLLSTKALNQFPEHMSAHVLTPPPPTAGNTIVTHEHVLTTPPRQTSQEGTRSGTTLSPPALWCYQKTECRTKSTGHPKGPEQPDPKPNLQRRPHSGRPPGENH